MNTLRRILPWLLLPIAIAALYDGWVFYSRSNDEQTAKARRQQKEAEAAKRIVDATGGDAVKILTFAASKGTLHRGEHTTLCYGVTNAAKVHMEPELPNVYPAYTNCLDIAPTKTTEYHFVAEDKSGKSVDAHLTIQVR